MSDMLNCMPDLPLMCLGTASSTSTIDAFKGKNVVIGERVSATPFLTGRWERWRVTPNLTSPVTRGSGVGCGEKDDRGKSM